MGSNAVGRLIISIIRTNSKINEYEVLDIHHLIRWALYTNY